MPSHSTPRIVNRHSSLNAAAAVTPCVAATKEDIAVEGAVSVRIPRGSTTVDWYAFKSSGQVVEVTIPHGVTHIHRQAFFGCENLEKVALPPTLVEIGRGAFGRCKRLRFIELPPSITSLDACAFQGCRALTSIRLPPDITEISSGLLENCSALTSVTIPERVETIGSYAFHGCRSLTEFRIPASVKSIEHSAFAYCREVIVAVIRNNNVQFRDNCGRKSTFEGCIRLKLVVSGVLAQSPAGHFRCCPVNTTGKVVDCTPVNLHRANALRYWSRRTHWLCSYPRQQWVVMVLLAAGRLAVRGCRLPDEMWVAILGWLLRSDLGHTSVPLSVMLSST